MINYKEETSFERTFIQANRFMRLVESYKLSNPDFFDYNVLYINALMASELFLKAVLLKYDKPPDELKKWSHNLKKLFDNLDGRIKENLKIRCKNFLHMDINQFLEKIKNDFVDCRYMFIENIQNEKKIFFEGIINVLYELQYLASFEIHGEDTYEVLK